MRVLLTKIRSNLLQVGVRGDCGRGDGESSDSGGNGGETHGRW